MKSQAAFGRDLDRRLKVVIQVHQDELKRARGVPDPVAEKFALEGCQYIDSLAKGTYALSQEIDTLPPAAAPLKQMTKATAARVFEASVRALEARAAKIQGAGPMEYVTKSMGAAAALTEASFYPGDGEYTWYNPADWARAAKYEAYLTAQQILSAGQLTEESLASAAKDAADKAGSVTMKYVGWGLGLALLAYAVKKKIQTT